jgi:putative membrane protein insertion efficiency factor
VKRVIERLLLGLIAGYQRWISPGLSPRCRYHPTCSAYAIEALRELGPLRGTIVAGWRLLRCNPLSNGGIDDLCDRRLFRDRTELDSRDRAEQGASATPRRTLEPSGAPR